MFKCIKSDFPIVEKRINSIIKKLKKYSIRYEYELLPETIEQITFYTERIDPVTSVTFRIYEGSYPMEIVNYNFSMDKLQLGEWKVVATIDHNQTYNSNHNVVNMIDQDAKQLPAWSTINPSCEHCNHNRKRNKTVILQDAQGNYKQVGTKCIKDFTGVDGIDVLGCYIEINDICYRLMEYDCSNTKNSSNKHKYVNTSNYLSICVDEILRNGYNKEDTKRRTMELYILGEEVSNGSKKEAQKIIEFFAQYGCDDDFVSEFGCQWSFYRNIANAINQEYCKPNGLVAYAYVAYNKAIDIYNSNKSKREQKIISKHMHNIGDKVQLMLTYIRSINYDISFNNGYSYITQYVHLFKDDEGNVYKWKTAKDIEKISGEQINVKGSVKNHSEFDGENQTDLTRCKLA